MVFEPPLLLMDEPLGALDKKLREQLQIEIKRVHRERRMSVLYVTHDQEEALTMSDRIAVFNNGQVEQIGTPEELYERPATRFVAGFIGETNFLPGRVMDIAGETCRVDVMGMPVLAAAGCAMAAGDKVVVAVRPERIRLSDAGTGLQGVLSDVIYIGNARKYVVRLAGGQDCIVLRQAVAGALVPNDHTVLSWDAGRAIAFPT
jgi:ABC-type Fe3+/spermidine/putrescine transport system ATPase subunit